MDPIRRLYGVYRGVVQDNKDPQNQRRLKIQVQTTGTEVTDWAWPIEPSSIHTAVPVIGQGVWVSYIGGDPEFPVWSGTFGTNQGNNKQIYVKPLDNSVSLTGLDSLIILDNKNDGTQELNLTDTLIAMAHNIHDGIQGSGIQGSTGTQGPTGTQGTQGTQGETGAGVQGAQGTDGTQGPYGVQGATGAGLQGVQGVQGTDGTQGLQGTQGVIGLTGAQGNEGVQGQTGTQGAIGTQGSVGSQGSVGTQGATGSQGTQGTQGVDGVQGTQGTTGTQGTVGTQGATGTQGTQGTQGTTGGQGVQGAQGTTGTQGSIGTQGTLGTQGSTGAQGAQGSQGTTGTQGALGTQGSVGSQGVQGTQGTTGPVGAGGTVAYYGNFYDDADQSTTVDTPTPIKFNHDYGSNGVSVQSDGTNLTKVTFANSGTYNIQFSAEFHNTGGGGNGQTVQVWFKKNGTDVPQSNTYVTVNTNSPYIVAAWNFLDTVIAGDYYQLIWQTDNSSIILDSFASSTNPAVPSVILTATQVAYAIQGTQGATGSQGTQGFGYAQAQGTQGLQGSQGSQGAQGITGSQGVQGVQGTQGVEGSQGNNNIVFQTGTPSSQTLLWVDTDDTTTIVLPAGGAGGYVLTKISGTDYDVSWAAPASPLDPFLLMGG